MFAHQARPKVYHALLASARSSVANAAVHSLCGTRVAFWRRLGVNCYSGDGVRRELPRWSVEANDSYLGMSE